MSRKEAADMRGVVEDQMARLDTAGGRMTELWSCCNEANAWTALYRKNCFMCRSTWRWLSRT